VVAYGSSVTRPVRGHYWARFANCPDLDSRESNEGAGPPGPHLLVA
jgi:hypothetical protein